mmetsp:Transcript_65119/g.153276  ORF Transcript_65119/g.153276 Transcript_65119/m.153276 type:complete len:177 (+) Transcript_65119:888-1418(+)
MCDHNLTSQTMAILHNDGGSCLSMHRFRPSLNYTHCQSLPDSARQICVSCAVCRKLHKNSSPSKQKAYNPSMDRVQVGKHASRAKNYRKSAHSNALRSGFCEGAYTVRGHMRHCTWSKTARHRRHMGADVVLHMVSFRLGNLNTALRYWMMVSGCCAFGWTGLSRSCKGSKLPMQT